MKKVLYWIFILVCSAALLFSVFMIARQGTKQRQIAQLQAQAIQTIEAMLPDRTIGFLEEQSNPALPAICVNGEDFVGILEVEQYSFKLPVLGIWDASSAKRPAVYFGNPYDGSLIIGVNYEDQFSFADRMEPGDSIHFTDLYGRVFSYQLDAVKHADQVDFAVLDSDSDDLTIFLKCKDTYLILRCSIQA